MGGGASKSGGTAPASAAASAAAAAAVPPGSAQAALAAATASTGSGGPIGGSSGGNATPRTSPRGPTPQRLRSISDHMGSAFVPFPHGGPSVVHSSGGSASSAGSGGTRPLHVGRHLSDSDADDADGPRSASQSEVEDASEERGQWLQAWADDSAPYIWHTASRLSLWGTVPRMAEPEPEPEDWATRVERYAKQELRQELKAMMRRHRWDLRGMATCLIEIKKCIVAVGRDWEDPEFSVINVQSEPFRSRVVPFEGGVAALRACGFELKDHLLVFNQAFIDEAWLSNACEVHSWLQTVYKLMPED